MTPIIILMNGVEPFGRFEASNDFGRFKLGMRRGRGRLKSIWAR